MNQVIREGEIGRVKPGFDGAPPRTRSEFSLRTETTPIREGIHVSSAALTEQIENGARAAGGETPAQLELKTWLSNLLQSGHLPYLGADTIGALGFRVGTIDKTAGYVYTQSLWDKAWGLPGKPSDGKTSVTGGQWRTNDMVIVLRLPLSTTSSSNRVGLVQAGIFNIEQGKEWYNMLKLGPHTQNLATLINLLFGLNSFGLGGKEALRDTATIQLPGGFPGQSLAHADFLQILPNRDFGAEISGMPKKHSLIRNAAF